MKNYAFLGCLMSSLILGLCACTAKNEELVYQSQTPLVSYPYPAIVATQTNIAYPPARVVPESQQAQVTRLPTETPLPTPAQVSAENLAVAKNIFEGFFEQLPFASEMGSVYKEYYGCQDSPNMGAALYYILSGSGYTSEGIKLNFVEYFDDQNMAYTPWSDLEVSGLNGSVWQTSAVQTLTTTRTPQMAIYVILLEYGPYPTPEDAKITPIPENEIPKAEIHLWVTYVESGNPIIPDSYKNIIKSCKEGWWFIVRP